MIFCGERLTGRIAVLILLSGRIEGKRKDSGGRDTRGVLQERGEEVCCVK